MAYVQPSHGTCRGNPTQHSLHQTAGTLFSQASECLQAMPFHALSESATMLSQATARILQSASGTATLTSADSKYKVALTRANVKLLQNCWLFTLAWKLLAETELHE